MELKSILSLGTWMVAVFLAAPFAVAHAGELPVFDESVSSSSEISTVTGTARFQRHHTLTPQLCTVDGCLKPKPYWSLVVEAGGSRFELSQVFAEGQDSAPEAIEIGSVVIRPGSRLLVKAHVQVVSRAFSLLSDLQSVQIVMDEDSALESRFSAENSPFFGWTCRSLTEAQSIYVDIEQTSRGSDYAMRVTSMEDSNLHTIARFDHVSLSMTHADIGFSGSAPNVHAELTIDQSGGRLNNLDSVLRISGRIHSAGPELPVEIPVETSVHLVCDRTR